MGSPAIYKPMPLNTRFIDTCKEIIEDSERQYCEDCKHCETAYWITGAGGLKFARCNVSHEGTFSEPEERCDDPHDIPVYRAASVRTAKRKRSYCSVMRIGNETYCSRYEARQPKPPSSLLKRFWKFLK